MEKKLLVGLSFNVENHSRKHGFWSLINIYLGLLFHIVCPNGSTLSGWPATQIFSLFFFILEDSVLFLSLSSLPWFCLQRGVAGVPGSCQCDTLDFHQAHYLNRVSLSTHTVIILCSLLWVETPQSACGSNSTYNHNLQFLTISPCFSSAFQPYLSTANVATFPDQKLWFSGEETLRRHLS